MKKPTELTGWFDGGVSPARNGVYQRLYDEGEDAESIKFCMFLNGVWFVYALTPKLAKDETVTSSFQKLRWRGLAQDPSKQ